MIRLLLLSTIVLSGHVFAQQSFSLLEAQNYALSNNPAAKIAELKITSAEEKIKETRAIGLPQVSASGEFNHFIDLPTQLIPAQFFNPMAGANDFIGVRFGTDFSVTGGLQVSQLLFDGSYLVGLQAAKMYPVLSQKEQEKVKQDIKANVAQSYYMVAIANKNISFLDDMMESTEKLKSYLNILAEKGMMDSAQIDQIDLNLKKFESQRRKAVLDQNLALKSLKVSMGIDISTVITISDDLDNIISSITAYPLNEEYAVESNINIDLLNTSKELQALNLKNKKAAYLPQLAAFFSHNQQAMRNEFNFFADEEWFPTSVWGVKLSIPIFSSGMRKSQVAQQEIELKILDAQIEQASQGITLEFEAAKSEFIGAKEIYDAEKAAYDIALKIKKRSDILYQKKMASMLEVAQADLQLEQSRSTLIQAMYALVNAKVKLDKINNSYE